MVADVRQIGEASFVPSARGEGAAPHAMSSSENALKPRAPAL